MTAAWAGDLLGGNAQLAAIQRAICEAFGVTDEDIVSRDRKRPLVILARHVAYLIARETTTASYPELGRWFQRDHTTVIAGVRKARRVAEKDERVRTIVERLRAERGAA